MAEAKHAEQPEEGTEDAPGPSEPVDDPTEDEGEGEDVQVEQGTEGAAEQPAAKPEGSQPPQSEKEMEKRQKAWDGARDTSMRDHEAADDYRYSISVICPLCEGHGLMYEPQTPEEGAQMRSFLLALVGETTIEELHDHPTFHRCDTCEGFGKVRTGSRVQGQEALPCPDCNGQGHSGGRSNVAALPAAVPPVTPAADVPEAEQERIGNDAWGRPPGHPHYGKLPALVS